ncbi:MAG TPA: GNAT family N-acetyltransferase [Anaerolineaceae bacterium]|jgi:ribosomal protein S18 acetylase RimI-like enzyme|nr:GNAT family N-acetyltransferase [Longilinea sp.]HOU43524.1 GNAT family N-acetyltransferase [Anaerolineaceae bacterium]HQF45806.1 GNAT family N-acetyltransferase [Anaerolineaceae bacterium]HQH35569.1 GNAT family N-acetyltransferase [Anaerolineaceae bacterium]HQJ03345.1 GNAT family N-acetyltransferase [Anaerolineaceae bacterium]
MSVLEFSRLREDPGWLERVVIRPVTAADLPLLEWEGEYLHFRRVFAGAFERQLAGLSVLWIAVLDCWAAGQVFIQYDSDRKELADGVERAYLYSFRVRPELRGQSLGTRIHQVVEEDLLQRGYRYITLNVAKENLRAQALYRRLGYRYIAHEPGRWSYPDHEGVWHQVEEPAWRMEKRLFRE